MTNGVLGWACRIDPISSSVEQPPKGRVTRMASGAREQSMSTTRAGLDTQATSTLGWSGSAAKELDASGRSEIQTIVWARTVGCIFCLKLSIGGSIRGLEVFDTFFWS